MKLLPLTRSAQRGYALLMVLGIMSISLLVLASAMNWCTSSANMTERSNQYMSTVAAAEAATEKVLTRIARDYATVGEGQVYGNLAAYRSLVPTTGEDAAWDAFEFSDAQGHTGQTYVERVSADGFVDLASQYSGLRGFASTYRVVSNARELNTLFHINTGVQQDLQVASIPIFQFAIFYGIDLEMNTMTTMNVRGRVHCNTTLYTYPSAPLTFYDDVTVVDDIIRTRKPGDPAYSSSPPVGTITYQEKSDTGVAFMSLPIGTNNSPTAVREVIQMPPTGESVNSPMGKQRYYNKSELTILVRNNGVTAFVKQPFNTTSNAVPWSELNTFVNTNATFTDQREAKQIRATQIDVSRIETWSMSSPAVQSAFGSSRAVNLIYVADLRTSNSSVLPAVRLINGQTLPNRGLTVATPNPLYVRGHFNQPTSTHLGTTNTSTTKPSSLVSDALTVLSSAWNDSLSSGSYANRDAVNTTLNAAVLTGIVPTSPGIYSGGVHNLGRFLEDWRGRTLTYNGSMVVLFDSARATAPFQQPGAYYYPPARDFAFDTNFRDVTKLPPGTPELRALIRGRWLVTKADTIVN